jgi:hypothetical protein
LDERLHTSTFINKIIIQDKEIKGRCLIEEAKIIITIKKVRKITSIIIKKYW